MIQIDRRKLALVACAIYIKRRLRKKEHTVEAVLFWVREIFRNREEKGKFQHFPQELRLHDHEYRQDHKKLCLIL